MAGRLAASLGLVALTTFVFYRLIPVNATTAALMFLLGILAVASRWDLLVSVIMSVAAMLCFNFFFLPPIGTFTIADPQNWIALAAFLITAVVTSKLSSSVREKAREALGRQREMERLYELSRSLMLTGPNRTVAGEVPFRLAEIFGTECASFYDRNTGRLYEAGSHCLLSLDAMKDIAQQGTFSYDRSTGIRKIPVSLGGHVSGSLAMKGGSISEAAVHALANLLAIVLERESAQQAVLRAEATRQNEELKSTLLDALAHEFKTPLTSIKAAATTLLAENSQTPTQHELLTVLNEETSRLTDMVTETIQMARIEAGELRVARHPVSAAAVVEEAVKRLRSRLEGRNLEIRVDPQNLIVQADPELITIVLQQLLDNAVKYTPPDSPLKIEVVRDGGEARFNVIDQGPGIPEYDQAHIFEKFYRGRGSRTRIPGTGMGLSIAMEIIKAHQGELTVDSHAGQGSTFSFTLPVHQVPGK